MKFLCETTVFPTLLFYCIIIEIIFILFDFDTKCSTEIKLTLCLFVS